jgi:hypothetical protein
MGPQKAFRCAKLHRLVDSKQVPRAQCGLWVVRVPEEPNEEKVTPKAQFCRDATAHVISTRLGRSRDLDENIKRAKFSERFNSFYFARGRKSSAFLHSTHAQGTARDHVMKPLPALIAFQKFKLSLNLRETKP